MCETKPKRKRILVLQDLETLTGREKFRGIMRYSQDHGHWEIDTHCYSRELPEPSELSRTVKSDGALDGAIVGQTLLSRYARHLRRLGCPIVLMDPLPADLDRVPALRKCPRVVLDEQSGAALAANHLVGKDANVFAFVGALSGLAWSHDRARFFTQQMAGRGFTVRVYEKAAEADVRMDRARLTRFLKELPKPVAVWAAQDKRAVQVIRLCDKLGFRVPEDVSVLGVDNDDILCESVTPRCSSVYSYPFGAGETAAALLDAVMRGDAVPEVTAYHAREVIERDSTELPGAIRNPVARRVNSWLKANAHRPVNISVMLSELRISRRSAETTFKQAYGLTMLQALHKIRRELAADLLRETALPHKEIALRCGYKSLRLFHNEIK